MTETAPRRLTIDEFFAWQEKQPARYELVDGFPPRMMAGAKNVHDDIVVNVLAELRNQLRGSRCRPFTSDGSVETKPGQIRRPDIGVDCGRRDPNAMKADLPRVVVEVLSPTREISTPSARSLNTRRSTASSISWSSSPTRRKSSFGSAVGTEAGAEVPARALIRYGRLRRCGGYGE